MKCKIITKHGGMPDSLFNKKALLEGMKIELEHTRSKCLAKQIAKDHLYSEGKKYYIYLKQMEKRLRKE